VSRRSFASLAGPADSVAMVQLTPNRQVLFGMQHPRIFAAGAGALGRLGATASRSPTLTKRSLKVSYCCLAQHCPKVVKSTTSGKALHITLNVLTLQPILACMSRKP